MRWWSRWLAEMGAVVLLAAGAAAAWNATTFNGLPPFRPARTAIGKAPEPFTSEEQARLRIGLAEVKQHWDRTQAGQPDSLLVDARPADRFQQGHIPDAVNLSAAQFDDPKLGWPFVKAFADQGHLVIVYCDGEGCTTSWTIGRMLQAKGIQNIRIFAGGWQEWIKADYPVAK